MVPITVYYSPYCPFCVMALRLLEERGLQPEKIRVDNDPRLKQQMIERSGRHTVPQIFFGERHVGGCDDLFALERSRGMDVLISGNNEPQGANNAN